MLNLADQVIICGRRLEQVESTAVELNAAAKESGNGGSVIALQADVATKQGVVDFFDKAKEHLDQVSYTLG